MPKPPAANTLYYGDNLDILRDTIADVSVDLVYLDPPFNSNATYNVLFHSPAGEGSQAQIEAFGDTGIDGYLYFKPDGKVTEKTVVSVKGWQNLNPNMVRDLVGTVDAEKAKMGVFLTLEDSTTGMRTAAAKADFYETEYGKYEKIQILTVEDLFDGKRPHMPWVDPSVFKTAKRENTTKQEKIDL